VHCDDIEIGWRTLLRLLAEQPGGEVRWVVFSSEPERTRDTRSGSGFSAAASHAMTVKQFGFFPGWPLDRDEFESLKSGEPPTSS
jgi:hypothetical protein